MPRQTFFNLSEEKREQVFRTAIDELAAYPYAAAGINRIVARAGIAKGSFYQYFEGKKDLFLYCLQRIGEEKMAYLAPVLQKSRELPFFELLQEIFTQGICFVQNHPEYGIIWQRILEGRESDLEEILREIKKQGEAFYRTLLEQAIALGEVRPDIDISLLAFLLTRLGDLVVEYHLERAGGTYDQHMTETAGQFIEVLRTGMAAHPTRASSEATTVQQEESA